ncbi:O-methyltransferase [Urechidicola croceus]|uniref:Methyltransferase n=1 Tax=Urechidicola croceus TaxID=1850246 RepID=A0A1D8P4C2_9FLAO|nr:class I SAM-dependent methyltransferase [Urechidicola croceus]AOW19444.1 methyltransferase [Urechidicola croceus]
MIYQLKSYIKFLFKSSNQHGVHSPFVFDLITKCFYKKTNPKKLKLITAYRNDLLQNTSIISVTDFGKGSKVFKSKERSVDKIAKIAGISYKRSKLLIRLTNYLNTKSILELGTSLGIGTASASIGNPQSQITTLEGCPETANIAINQFKKFNINNINTLIGDFNKILPPILNNNYYDLIYFDGNHQKKPTLDYFKLSLNSIHNDTVFIFDDIHWSKEMTEAWEEIKNHPKVTVTIDTFFWGFVFFRAEQLKEHFIIRV